jgi:hypothetical protein
MSLSFPDKLVRNPFALQHHRERMPSGIGAYFLIYLQLFANFVHVLIDPLGKFAINYGVKDQIDTCSAYLFLKLIISYPNKRLLKEEYFQIWN